MKKIIITGAPRTGTTALCSLLSHSSNILVTNELGLFHPDKSVYPSRKDSRLKHNTNSRLLELKNLTAKDIDDFYLGDYKNKKNLEFFGDKLPSYCSSFHESSQLVKNYPDAYFIFTYRNILATIYSGIKRSQKEKNENADWFFKNFEESARKIIFSTLNWATNIYPFVKNKIIIDYDYYINNANLLVNDLSIFLNTKLDIQEPENLYFNRKSKAYKILKGENANGVLNLSIPIDQYVKSLINNY